MWNVRPVSRPKAPGRRHATRYFAPLDIAIAASIALLGNAIAVAQECPTSCLSGDATEAWESCSRSASHRKSVGMGWPHNVFSRASYDLRLATFRADINVPNQMMGSGAVIATDRFRVVGPASDTPLALTVRLHIFSDLCPTDAGLWEGGGSVSDLVPIWVWPDGEAVLELQIRHRPGEDFELRYGGRVRYDSRPYDALAGGAYCNLRGVLDFVAVPPGYSIQSCQGYSSPVAVAPTTWTHAKMLYRN